MFIYFQVFYLFLVSSFCFGESSLVGGYTMCDSKDARMDREHLIHYTKNGLEFHSEIYSIKSKNPCKGTKLFVEGALYRYQENKDEVISTIIEKDYYLIHSSIQKFFMKEQFCGIKNWPLREFIYCRRKENSLINDESYFTVTHRFKILKNKLILIDEDESVEFAKESEIKK